MAETASEVILVVEDLADTRDSLRVLLELYGYLVQTAHDGQAGLSALLSLRPSLGIIDVGLPKMNGYEVAKLARAAGLKTPLIALTGYATEADRERALKAGFDVHIAKPAHPDDLVAIVGQLLAAA